MISTGKLSPFTCFETALSVRLCIGRVTKWLVLLVLQIGLVLGLGTRLHAQEQPPLTVAFIPISPYAEIDAHGERSGFLVELAEEIGRELDIGIEFVDVANAREFIQAQIEGRTQMIAGVARLPLLQDTNVFSSAVARESLRLAVLAENFGQGAATPTGVRLGIVPPAVGSQVAELLERNTVVEFATPEAALMALMVQDVEGILLPNPAAVAQSRKAGLDYRIAFVGPNLREFDRVIALHESRADLLPQLNEAIARMEADGRLEDLRQRHFFDVPPSVPDVATVGVSHFPPHLVVGQDGEISGFIPEAMRDIAELADIEIEFVEIGQNLFVQGPAAAQTDLVAGLVDTAERRERMDFTYPLRQVPISAAFPPTDQPASTGLHDLVGRRLAVLEGSIVERIAQEQEGVDVISYASNSDAVAALIAGNVDGALATNGAIEEIVQEQGLGDQIWIAPNPVASVDTAIALRFGLGGMHRRMDVVIPGYLLSNRYSELEQKYYGVPVFWTPFRLYGALALAGLVFVTLLGLVVVLHMRRREEAFVRQKQDLAREIAHSQSLAKLVSELELSNKEQAEFTYSISHDLKAPTNTMGLLISELDELGEVGPGAQSIMSEITATNSRMRQLIDDVLNYSEVIGQKTAWEKIDLNELVDTTLKDLAAEISVAGATVTRDDLPSILGHMTQLRSLFQNLISNGVKFRSADRGPVVHISAVTLDGRIILHVADNGIGIPKDQEDSIFRLFSRLHSRSAYEGSGLGLAICRRVMINCGGSISFRPREGGGTVFELDFGTNDLE